VFERAGLERGSREEGVGSRVNSEGSRDDDDDDEEEEEEEKA